MVARANERASRMTTTGAEQAMALSAKEFCRRTQDRCVLRCLRWRHIDGRRAADLHADLPMTEGSGRALLIDGSTREAVASAPVERQAPVRFSSCVVPGEPRKAATHRLCRFRVYKSRDTSRSQAR